MHVLLVAETNVTTEIAQSAESAESGPNHAHTGMQIPSWLPYQELIHATSQLVLQF